MPAALTAQQPSAEPPDHGRVALSINPSRWKQIETQHFVVHFERSGERIACRCEDFYAEIREFFGSRPDLQPESKSHVYAFRDAGAWEKFKKSVGVRPTIVGVTVEREFFWMAAGEKGQLPNLSPVQRHEMTHLVFNRLFTGRPPLWLNEGIAEFFGRRRERTSTAYRQELRGARGFVLPELFTATSYPATAMETQAFYAEASAVVLFLTRRPDQRAVLPKFVDALIAGQTMTEEVRLYGYAGLDELTREYQRFAE